MHLTHLMYFGRNFLITSAKKFAQYCCQFGRVVRLVIASTYWFQKYSKFWFVQNKGGTSSCRGALPFFFFWTAPNHFRKVFGSQKRHENWQATLCAYAQNILYLFLIHQILHKVSKDISGWYIIKHVFISFSCWLYQNLRNNQWCSP